MSGGWGWGVPRPLWLGPGPRREAWSTDHSHWPGRWHCCGVMRGFCHQHSEALPSQVGLHCVNPVISQNDSSDHPRAPTRTVLPAPPWLGHRPPGASTHSPGTVQAVSPIGGLRPVPWALCRTAVIRTIPNENMNVGLSEVAVCGQDTLLLH